MLLQTPADALAFSPDEQHALSKASKKSKAPAALLSMEQPPAQLDTAPASPSAAGHHFNVAAVSTAGRLCVWLCEVGDAIKATLRATIQIEQDSAT